ncbi:inositol polyphosphate 5-phosphatase K isoform X1 [Helicoverpa armigera]|uniref:inositol polyphosphate 5-phosphatase K isoform X1 n=1 Tax=Helicoverpa armigera TaxID=29058 RepID=UPI001F57311B|nr:inositol polyphosphate 5-phosphatase K isoform X1 [Helicoverpa armigera]XP_047029750.1 inositol polyphosphate 5-phosphatase K-like isoform X1 [Helicoverpa zea]
MDTLRFYFVTWNVATKNPGQDLNALLDFPSQFNKNKPLPDFYVIGLQEVKSQPQNLVMDSLFTDSWTSAFNKILCRQGYIVAKATRLQGILLIVYTQMKHVIHLRDIEAQYTKTGLGGMWGNKGAVSIRFNIYGCSVCLVNSHLTAHEHLLADRINDYNTIIKQHQYHVKETTNILYHDYVIWLGDLNFRTDHPAGSSPTSEEIVAQLQKIEKDKYAPLLSHDQLIAVMDSGEAFSEFTEHDIRFPPTYKFSIGGDEYDIRRKPSWTDRILYKVNANNYENVTLRADVLSYNHIPHYTVSDHKPVVAQVNIKIRAGISMSIIAEPPPIHSSIRMRSLIIPPQLPTLTEASMSSIPESKMDLQKVTTFGAILPTMPDSPTHDSPDSPTNEFTNDIDVPEGNVSMKVALFNALDAGTVKTFSNYTEKTVEFAPITRIWYIGDADFRTQCTLSPDIEVNDNDWIGIYDANFHNLDDYIAYEYLAKVSIPSGPTYSGQPRTITLSFPLGSGVRTPGFYRFIYFSQTNNDVRSVLGISEPFEVSSKEDSLVVIDPCEQAAGSSSPGRSKPSSANTDIFTDFTGLDVAKLSRHFSNDLSID